VLLKTPFNIMKQRPTAGLESISEKEEKYVNYVNCWFIILICVLLSFLAYLIGVIPVANAQKEERKIRLEYMRSMVGKSVLINNERLIIVNSRYPDIYDLSNGVSVNAKIIESNN